MKKYFEYKKEFAKLKYEFRMNEMNDSIECNGGRLTDPVLATIESKMVDAGYKSAPGIKRNLMRLASENSYHPIKEWFSGLVWGGEDIFGQMMDCFEFEHQQISRVFVWRFLLGCVGKVASDGWQQNVMLILDGAQDLGKSHWAGWLLSNEMKRYFVEGGLNPGSKDTLIRMVGNFMWEIGELQGITRKSDLEALKNTITQRRMNVRLPYGRFDMDKPITCSFIGTVNENGAGFLNDVTGSRRFAIVKVLALNWNYDQLDTVQLWAQIYSQYQQGERGMLTMQEKSEQKIINVDYGTLSHVEQILLSVYEIDPVKYADEWIPISQIIKTLENHGLATGKQRLHYMELAGILIKYRCGKSRKGVATGYGRAVCYAGICEKTTKYAPII